MRLHPGSILPMALVVLAAARVDAQPVVYAVTAGAPRFMCSATGCLGPAVTLVNPATGIRWRQLR
jgi:hypothetical protein